MPSAPGTTKVVTFYVDDEDGDDYDPPSVVVMYGLVDTEPTTIDPGQVENPAVGTYRVKCPCPTDGDYGARLEAWDGDVQLGALEKYWHIAPSRLHVPT